MGTKKHQQKLDFLAIILYICGIKVKLQKIYEFYDNARIIAYLIKY